MPRDLCYYDVIALDIVMQEWLQSCKGYLFITKLRWINNKYLSEDSPSRLYCTFIGCDDYCVFFTIFSTQFAVSVQRTSPPWPSRRVWCPKTVRHLIGHRGAPALRPAGPPTCLLVTACGHESWRRSQSVGGNAVLPLRKKKLATS